MKQIQFKANITGTGKYLPENILTNHDMEDLVETSDEWIRTRTGIQERRIVQNGEASAEMSTKAIQNLMKDYNLKADEIDVIIVATITPDMMFPSTAALIQDNLKAVNAWGYDLSAACSGFLFALQSGAALIASGQSNKVIVVGVDTMSSILDFTDRNTCILFGDGAGAVLLEPSADYGIMDAKFHIDGSGGKHLHMPAGGSLQPATQETVHEKLHYVRQDGKTVFKYAVKEMANISFEVAQRNNLSSEDIDLFIPHQANKRIIDAVAKKLDLKKTQVMVNIERYANTTSATIPICLAEAAENSLLDTGDNVILSSFGAGFTWGAMYIKWGIMTHA